MAKESESQQLLAYHLKCLNDCEIPNTEQRRKRLQFLQQNAILKTVLPEGVVEQLSIHNSNQSPQQLPPHHQTQSSSKQRNSLPEVETGNISSTPLQTKLRTGPGPMPERDPRKEIRFTGGNKKVPIILQIRGYHRELSNQDVLEFLQNVKQQLENNNPIDIEFAIKGYVYIKFSTKKDAYLYYKKLLQIRKNNPNWCDIKTDFAPYIPRLDDKMSPLLVFINSKSGGGDGQILYQKLVNCLDKEQVYRLEKGGPCPGLIAFRHQPNFRILACGGDGTCSWVMSVLEEMKQCIGKDGFLNMACQNPPIGVIPLGTGNDLARVLGYGGGYTVDNSDGVVSYIRKVQNAAPKELDRWSLSFKLDTTWTELQENQSTVTNQNTPINSLPVTTVTVETPDVKISSTSKLKQAQQQSSKTSINNSIPHKSSTDNKHQQHELNSNLTKNSSSSIHENSISSNSQTTRPHTTPAAIERQTQITKQPSSFKPAPLRKTPTFTSEMPTNRYGSRMSYIVRPEFIKDVLIDSEAAEASAALNNQSTENQTSITKTFENQHSQNQTNLHQNSEVDNKCFTLPLRQSSEAEHSTASASDNKQTSESDHSDDDSLSDCEEALQTASLGDISEEDPMEMKCMTNYFSVGLDAELALSFHRAREEHPERFNSRLYNKSVYVKSAMKRMTSDFMDVSTMVNLVADGKKVKLPKGTIAIVLSNIPSYSLIATFSDLDAIF